MAAVIRQLAGPEKHLFGMSLARILVGAAGVHYYLSNHAYRHLMFGPHAYVAGTGLEDRGLTVYALARDGLTFDLLYHAGLVAALAFGVLGGRVLAGAHAAFFWSLHARNVGLFDGGDAFGRIVTVVMVLVVTNAYLAPGAARRRIRLARERDPSWRRVLHNAAVVMVVFQLAVVYLSAAVFKLMDGAWRSGTALHQIAQLEDYRFVTWEPAVRNALLVGVLTYGAMALEMGFVGTLWRRSRLIVVASLAAMHLVLAVVMGLVGFALHMWAGLAVCLADDDYRRLSRSGPCRPVGSPATSVPGGMATAGGRVVPP